MRELFSLLLRFDLRGLLLRPSNNGVIQLFRSLFVGAIATVVDAGSLWLLERAGLHYLLAALLGFTLGVAVNYLLSSRFVFAAARSGVSKAAEFGVFVLLGAVGLGLTELLMWLMTGKLGLHYMLSKAAATVVVFLWNFFGRKFILYRNTEKGKP